MHDELTDEQLRNIQQKLELSLAELKSVLSDKGEAEIVELDQSRVGRLSRIDAIQRQQFAKMQQGKMKKSLQELFLALQRIKLYTEDYGYCEECGELIPYRRLLVRPESRFCVPCLQSQGG